MLIDYEVSLGLTELSSVERDVLFAFRLVQEDLPPDSPIASEEVKRHGAVADIPHASYHRAVRSLVNKGFLRNDRYGAYRISEELEDSVPQPTLLAADPT